jgi:hypothetical protein
VTGAFLAGDPQKAKAMTDHAPASVPAPVPRRRPSLYRTVLSLGVAAIAATWLPFSFLYINALNKHALTVSATAPLHARTTTTTTAAQPATLTPVTTRTS